GGLARGGGGDGQHAEGGGAVLGRLQARGRTALAATGLTLLATGLTLLATLLALRLRATNRFPGVGERLLQLGQQLLDAVVGGEQHDRRGLVLLGELFPELGPEGAVVAGRQGVQRRGAPLRLPQTEGDAEGEHQPDEGDDPGGAAAGGGAGEGVHQDSEWATVVRCLTN